MANTHFIEQTIPAGCPVHLSHGIYAEGPTLSPTMHFAWLGYSTAVGDMVINHPTGGGMNTTVWLVEEIGMERREGIVGSNLAEQKCRLKHLHTIEAR